MKLMQPKWLISVLSNVLLVGYTYAQPPQNLPPDFIRGEIFSQHYGLDADLLTAGVGSKGLASRNKEPKFNDPDNPTAGELRKQAIFNNFRALQDTSKAAGYGTLYGPNVPPTDNDGRVTGKEYIAYSDNGSGQQNVVLLVQVPDSFDVDNPCIVTGPSPGSRGLYGAVGASGEWGLKQGCAVAYTDNGKGIGLHDIGSDTVNLINGTRTTAEEAGIDSQFTAKGDLAAYNTDFPHRIAMKHAHSQQNPEADWGKYVLQSIEFAFYVLNLPENYGKKRELTPKNTIVIASSISNGGGASIRAAEQDTKGLIDGVVVSEPNINPRKLADTEGFDIKQGEKIFTHDKIGKSLLSNVTYYNLYQPCASANTELKLGAPIVTGFKGRCTALQQAGLLKAETLEAQVIEAQSKLNDYALLDSTNPIAHTYTAFDIYASIATLYPNAYGRFLVTDNLCGYSYAYVKDETVPEFKTPNAKNSGVPEPKPQAILMADFAAGNGIPPTNSTFLINNSGNNGKGINFRKTKTNGLFDKYLDGALCSRRLATGEYLNGNLLEGKEAEQAKRIKKGIDGILGNGNLQGKPAIIVHGRDDALIAVNHTSRYYYGLNKKTEINSQLAYIEVKHANHLDALNALFNIGKQIPLHYYFVQGLDIMYAHLKHGKALPNSQVIKTKPLSETGGDRLQAGVNLPDIGSKENCKITFKDNFLYIPECG